MKAWTKEKWEEYASQVEKLPEDARVFVNLESIKWITRIGLKIPVLKAAVTAYRLERRYGDAGWGEYLAFAIENFLELPAPDPVLDESSTPS